MRSHRAALVAGYDPATFIPPLKLRRIDSIGRIALGATRQALDDARLDCAADGDRIGLVLGSATAGGETTGRVPGAPAQRRTDRCSRAALRQHGRQRCRQSLRTRVRPARPEHHDQPQGGVGLWRRSRLPPISCAWAARPQSPPEAPTISTSGSSPCTTGSTCSHAMVCIPKAAVHSTYRGTASSSVRADSCASWKRQTPRHAAARTCTARSSASEPADPENPSTDGHRLPPHLRGRCAPRSRMRRAQPKTSGRSTHRRTPRAQLDPLEAEAIAEVFDPDVPVTSIKGAVGEFGAVGAAAAIAALACGGRGMIAPTSGLASRDPSCRVNATCRAPRTRSAARPDQQLRQWRHAVQPADAHSAQWWPGHCHTRRMIPGMPC